MFTTKSLQQAFELSKPVIDNISSNLNKITAEINALEKYLKNANLLDNFAYSLSVEIEHRLTTMNYEEHSVEGKYYFLVRKGLLWNNNEKKILYYHQECNLGTDDPDYNNYFNIEDKVDSLDSFGGWDAALDNDKPLLETKFQTRKNVLPFLAGFLTAIARQYDIFNVQEELPKPKVDFDDDIPF